MFDVTSPTAQDAVRSIADWLSGFPDAQVPMPSPNNAPRRASTKKTPEKKVELAPQLARKRSQDFATKIQGWNDAGGGVHQKQDEVVVIHDADDREVDVQEDVSDQDAPDHSPSAWLKTPTSGAKGDVKAVDAKKNSREVDLNRKAWVRRKSRPQAEIAVEVKSAGTPKKRVVSDGHWRRDRNPKDENVEVEKEKEKKEEKSTTPKPITIRRSVVSVGLKVPVSVKDFVETIETQPSRTRPLRERDSRSRSHSRSDNDRALTPDYESTGTKVYIQRRKPSRLPNDLSKRSARYKTSESSLTATSSFERPSSVTDFTTPSPSPVKESHQRPVSEPRPLIRKSLSGEGAKRPRTARRSTEAEDSSPRLSSARKRSRDLGRDDEFRRGSSNLQVPARDLPKAPAAANSPRLHGNRIEGWLAGTTDPFTESKDQSMTPPPLEITKKKSPRPRDLDRDSSDGEETRRKSSTRRRVSHRGPGRKEAHDGTPPQATDDWSDASPSGQATLRRSGATKRGSRSPVKDRTSRGNTPSADDMLMTGALPVSNVDSGSPTTRPARRPVPSAEKRLSTLAAIDALTDRSHSQRRRAPSETSEQPTIVPDGSMLSRASDGDLPRRQPSGLKRRGTKHSDLMSVLSMSQDDSHPLMPARSVRARRPRQEVVTIQTLMNELSADELKYQRELRTLVDGVIPVLLQYTLAGTGTKGNRSFSRSLSDPSVTRPITDMGIALERLKTSHRRIPMHSALELLTWAEGAAKIYSEYLICWRLGFKNLVVNLAPANDPAEKADWDHDLARDKHGDLVDGHGEQVDVAYLLKRPLVRVKALCKILKSINDIEPSPKAGSMATKYIELLASIKQRTNDEHARLEDEAAASIDATRARDPRSLAPITGVAIDATRCVRARDYFDMDLVHSSGQQLGCKIELVYRDDAPGRGSAGDLLFCEVSISERWLLFPPLPRSLVSARKGETPTQLVVMVRGFMSNAQQWREVMSLEADEEGTCVEWLQMLGSSPMPPRMSRKSSFNMLKEVGQPLTERAPATTKDVPRMERLEVPSQRELEVPIGEQPVASSRIWDASEVNSVSVEDTSTELQREKARKHRSMPSSPNETDLTQEAYGYGKAQPEYFYDKPKHARSSEFTSRRPQSSHAPSQSEWSASTWSASQTEYNDRTRPSERSFDESTVDDDERTVSEHNTRPSMHRRTSSVPSLELPTIPKLRRSQPSTPVQPSVRQQSEAAAKGDAWEPSSAPAAFPKRQSPSAKEGPQEDDNDTPQSSRSRPTSLGLKIGSLPSFTPAFLKKTRRPSSPLKHEYEPSTASDSLSDSGLSDSEDATSDTSDSTADDEAVSTIGDLKDFHDYTRRPLHQVPPSSQFSLPDPSLAPSESASQAPYRAVPPAATAPAKTVASIFCWSETGSWDPLHTEECSVFVTPGLIEAFDMTQAQSVATEGDTAVSPFMKGIKPLVALELTPLVPLRRGTAVDISIRSPPTSSSLLRTGNNIMFRSRSPEECERLYALINRARIDNPTYIALSNARGPVQQSNWAEIMDQRNASRATSGSWWQLGSRRGSTYRSTGSRAASTAATESSVGTMNTAFSALRRFSGSNRLFNIAKSTITSREGTRSSNSESLSSGAATPVPPLLDPRLGTPLGITNAKVRLYVRESTTKWRDLGSARLTVMLPPRPAAAAVPADPRTTGLEKRVLVFGKSTGETMLDVTLGETAFERVARTGIAVSVYSDFAGAGGEIGRAGAVGGVNPGRTTVYMIQMKSEREAAYTFGLVGRFRY